MKLTEREKAYHDGYKQGRFDEYAERMGYGQAEKVKAKLDKQKNCPYCHGGRKAEPLVNEGPDFLAFDENGSVAFGDDGAITIHADVFNYCPMCGRPLNEEEE